MDLTFTADELVVLQLALGDRIEAMETECWRGGDDDTASTHNPMCDCYYNTEAKKAGELLQRLDNELDLIR